MKKRIEIYLICILVLMGLCACTEKGTIDLLYGETHQIESNKLEKYGELHWFTSNSEVASVQNGLVSAVGVGTAFITAEADSKNVGEYTIIVSAVPITGIVLSSEANEIVEGEIFKLEYTLFPENATPSGLTWKSTDESIVSVDQTGTVTGIAPGQATITASGEDGIYDTCSITVTQKAAYDRLSEKERAFVDLAMKYLDSFKNPASVVINEIDEATLSNTWIVKVSAQNGFGGKSVDIYMLDDTFGFWNWDSFDLDLDLKLTPDKSYDIKLINEAIEELR